MDKFRVRVRGTTRTISILVGDLKHWHIIEALAKSARDGVAQSWIERQAKPYGILGQQGMGTSANSARNGKGALVKYAVTGTQFHQLLRAYRIFILFGVTQDDFVADIAPHFKDFVPVPPKIVDPEGLMRWVEECDPDQRPSPSLSDRFDVRSPGTFSVGSSSRSSSMLELEQNDALSPGPEELVRSRRGIEDESNLRSAPLPPAMSALFTPIASTSGHSAFADFSQVPARSVSEVRNAPDFDRSLMSPRAEENRGLPPPNRPEDETDFSPQQSTPHHDVVPPSFRSWYVRSLAAS